MQVHECPLTGEFYPAAGRAAPQAFVDALPKQIRPPVAGGLFVERRW
jgi:hypothetical protein